MRRFLLALLLVTTGIIFGVLVTPHLNSEKPKLAARPHAVAPTASSERAESLPEADSQHPVTVEKRERGWLLRKDDKSAAVSETEEESESLEATEAEQDQQEKALSNDEPETGAVSDATANDTRYEFVKEQPRKSQYYMIHHPVTYVPTTQVTTTQPREYTSTVSGYPVMVTPQRAVEYESNHWVQNMPVGRNGLLQNPPVDPPSAMNRRAFRQVVAPR